MEDQNRGIVRSLRDAVYDHMVENEGDERGVKKMKKRIIKRKTRISTVEAGVEDDQFLL